MTTVLRFFNNAYINLSMSIVAKWARRRIEFFERGLVDVFVPLPNLMHFKERGNLVHWCASGMKLVFKVITQVYDNFVQC